MQRKRLTLTLPLTAIALVALTLSASVASAAPTTLCVGGKPSCYTTIQAAVDAARDGDTIQIAPGTYAGGVVIDVSVNVVGAGAQATVIRGGGPVVTIGKALAPDPPTVSIRSLTITGGNVIARGDATFAALGGGVLIEIAENFGRGAKVTISDSVITGNRASPQATAPGGDFALAQGGGIDNFGDLTLANTKVTSNEVGSTPGLPSLATEANAGGIYNHIQAALTLEHSVVSSNRTRVTSPHEGEANAGGIFSYGELMIRNSIVSDNSAELESSAPMTVDQIAVAGGIHAGFCPVEFCGPSHPTTITNTIVRGNRVFVRNVNPGGLTVGFAGGIDVDASLLLERSVVSDNVVRSVSAGDATADGGGLEVDGEATIRDTIISHNGVVAEAVGFAFAAGGGIANAGQLTLERTLVLDNSVSATGSGAEIFGFPSAVTGGGIWNGSFEGQTTAHLTLSHSAVLRNSLSAPSSFVIQGGGLYTAFPVIRTATLIAANKPDQCFGC